MGLLKLRLDKGSFIPLYSQIYAAIAGMITKGDLKEGDSLPSEAQLCGQLGVSRHTVRQALTLLGKDGYILAQSGKGSFVAQRTSVRPIVIALLVIGFSEQIYQSRQGVYGSLVRGVAEVTATSKIPFNVLHFPRGTPLSTCLAGVDRAVFGGFMVRTYESIAPADIETLDAVGVPYVIIKRRVPGRTVSAVLHDEIKGGYLAVEHLLKEGHREIGVVAGPREIQVFADRIAGAEQAMAAQGLILEPTHIQTAPNSIDEDGFSCTNALLAAHPQLTALFVASDLMALGAYEAIRQRGLRIPHHVSIVGFDDIEAASRLSPPLTTIRTSYFDLGASATALLLDLIRHNHSGPAERTIEPALIVRESTSRPVRL